MTRGSNGPDGPDSAATTWQFEVFLETKGARRFERNRTGIDIRSHHQKTEPIKQGPGSFKGRIESIHEIGRSKGAKLHALCEHNIDTEWKVAGGSTPWCLYAPFGRTATTIHANKPGPPSHRSPIRARRSSRFGLRQVSAPD